VNQLAVRASLARRCAGAGIYQIAGELVAQDKAADVARRYLAGWLERRKPLPRQLGLILGDRAIHCSLLLGADPVCGVLFTGVWSLRLPGVATSGAPII
jgi:hypothetical protein